MIKELELRIKKLLKKRWEESESQEAVAKPLVDKLPDLCVNCFKCYWTSEGEKCSGDCQLN